MASGSNCSFCLERNPDSVNKRTRGLPKNIISKMPAGPRADVAAKLTKQDLKAIKDNASSVEQYDIDEVEAIGAVRLFIDSKVVEAEQILRKKCTTSMIHCHANGVLAMLKALMTVRGLIDYSLIKTISVMPLML